MCYAFNHDRFCPCGFGGVGHAGRGGGTLTYVPAPRCRAAGALRSVFPSSMTQRAMELGHSLLFPAVCRHCGRFIFLFADPNGGRAIFDAKGRPWPKHQCGALLYRTGPAVPDEGEWQCFGVPVPADAYFVEYETCKLLFGTVVSVITEEHPRIPRLFRVILHHDRKLFRVRTFKKLKVGTFVAGDAFRIPDVGYAIKEPVRLRRPPSPENIEGYVYDAIHRKRRKSR